MSKVTTRLANQDIVNIARQQYENKQRSKLPSIIVDLPSKGLIYPESSLLRQGKIEIRYMTAYDEDILTNSSYIQTGIVFDKLLESIIISPIAIEDIAPSDRDALVIYSRIVSYGAEYPVMIQDPKTKNQLERIVDLNNLLHKPFNLTADENGEFDYAFGSNKLKFAYNVRLKENITITELMSLIITEINGNRSKQDIEAFIRHEFLARDAKQFREYFANNTPGLDFKYEFEGEDGSTFIAPFPVKSDLFWF
jgi:hypothetical protein